MCKISHCIIVCAVIASALVQGRSQNIAGPIIKKGTKAALVLGDRLSSRQSAVGDLFACALKEPVRVGDQVVLPARTRVLGHVVSVTPWSPGQPRSEIRLELDNIILPSGKTRADIQISSVDERDRDTGAFQARAYGGTRSGYAANGTSLASNRYGSGGHVPTVTTDAGTGPPFQSSVLIFGNALGGAVTARNGDVVLNAGTVLRVRFAEALTVPLSEHH